MPKRTSLQGGSAPLYPSAVAKVETLEPRKLLSSTGMAKLDTAFGSDHIIVEDNSVFIFGSPSDDRFEIDIQTASPDGSREAWLSVTVRHTTSGPTDPRLDTYSPAIVLGTELKPARVHVITGDGDDHVAFEVSDALVIRTPAETEAALLDLDSADGSDRFSSSTLRTLFEERVEGLLPTDESLIGISLRNGFVFDEETGGLVSSSGSLE